MTFALGVFRRRTAGTGAGVGPEFTGLVRGGRVRDVSALGTVNDLLADWDSALAALAELADHADDADHPADWADLADLDVRCPVAPRQILQCGANYRSHVVDIVMAERRADESMTGHNSDLPEHEVRAWAEAMMDERAATGSPYVFTGLPSALAGPYDEIVLPERGANHDWELELALVVGDGQVNVAEVGDEALGHGVPVLVLVLVVTWLRWRPSPVISPSSTSPSARNTPQWAPFPAGEPVSTRSPGPSSVTAVM